MKKLVDTYHASVFLFGSFGDLRSPFCVLTFLKLSNSYIRFSTKGSVFWCVCVCVSPAAFLVGFEGATRDQIVKAAKVTHAHDFIEELSDG